MPSFLQIVKQLPALVEKEKTEWEQAIANHRNKSAIANESQKRKIGFIIPCIDEEPKIKSATK